MIMELICLLFSKRNLFRPLQRMGMILVKTRRRNHGSGHLLITVHETLNGRATSHLSGPLNSEIFAILTTKVMVLSKMTTECWASSN
jgi:hypothetical protein